VPDAVYTDAVVLTFVVIPAVLVAILAWGVAEAWTATGASPGDARRASLITTAVAMVWMAASWQTASSGVLRNWDATPPPLMLFVGTVLILAGALAFGPAGSRLAAGVPLWALVAVQSFRFPLEVAMHAMYERGVMPVVMSYSGRNFDIITGFTALVVSALVAAGRGGRVLVFVWNLLGLALLINVMTVAILATPRFRYFGDDSLNIWVTYPPFVWLPAVMVLAALAGHLVIFKALSTSRNSKRF
jgi:hypothetical protein